MRYGNLILTLESSNFDQISHMRALIDRKFDEKYDKNTLKNIEGDLMLYLSQKLNFYKKWGSQKKS
jgi:hypothetical protein